MILQRIAFDHCNEPAQQIARFFGSSGRHSLRVQTALAHTFMKLQKEMLHYVVAEAEKKRPAYVMTRFGLRRNSAAVSLGTMDDEVVYIVLMGQDSESKIK